VFTNMFANLLFINNIEEGTTDKFQGINDSYISSELSDSSLSLLNKLSEYE
jgi:hypothetical protein